MKNYQELFEQALKDSKELKIYAQDISFNNMTYIAEWLMYELGPKIAENFSRNGFSTFLGLPQNALRLHHFFKPIVDDLLKIESVITTGFVKIPNDANEVEEFGKISLSDVQTALKDKALPEKIHNWLTLPSGEIIDIAFMTIYGRLYNEDSLIGNIVAKSAKDLTGGMEYHPIILGEEFYEKCNFSFDYDKELFLQDSFDDEEE